MPLLHSRPAGSPLSPAASTSWIAGGLKRGDEIVAINGTPAATFIAADDFSALDIGLTARAPEGFDPVDLADLCGISRFAIKAQGDPEVTDLRQEPRCERSWKRDGTVKQRSDGGLLSDRDAAALGV